MASPVSIFVLATESHPAGDGPGADRGATFTSQVWQGHGRKIPAWGVFSNQTTRMIMKTISRWLTSNVASALFLLASWSAYAGWLTVGPDYKQPTNFNPSTYKAEELGNWKVGSPLDNVPKGAWWEVFEDPELNGLESEAIQANQNLKATVARVQQARAVARVARADLMPSVNFEPSFIRQRYSPNQNPSFGSITANSFSVPLDLSYEIDLWGRVRRGFEAARDDAQASLADFYNFLLTRQADVAQNYFTLRALDAEIATVAATVELRHQQVRLVRSRFEGGIGSELDVARAETELAQTEADAASIAQRRAELEN